MKPAVSVTSSGGFESIKAALRNLTRKQVYVGIPATTAMDRKRQLMTLAGAAKSKRRRARFQGMAVTNVINNAELMFILTQGSPKHHTPPRPVVEPAIEDKQNSEAITHELELAGRAALEGKPEEVDRQLNLAGVVAANKVKGWFVNSRNGWAPNRPSTIRRKGSSRPNIDTGALRNAVTYVMGEKE
jgi:hypothetical protein